MPIPSKGKRKVENEEPTGSEWSSVLMSRKGKVVENGSPQRRAKFIDPKRGEEEEVAMARGVGDSSNEKSAIGWNVEPIFGNTNQLLSSVPPIYKDPKRGKEDALRLGRDRARHSFIGQSSDERNAKSPIGRGLDWTVKPIFGNKYQLTSSVPPKHRQREPIYKDSKARENESRLRREMVDAMHAYHAIADHMTDPE